MKKINKDYTEDFSEDGANAQQLTSKAIQKVDMARDILGFMEYIIKNHEREVTSDMAAYKKKATALKKVIYVKESSKDLKQLYDEYTKKYNGAKRYYKEIQQKKQYIAQILQNEITQHKEIVNTMKIKPAKENAKKVTNYIG